MNPANWWARLQRHVYISIMGKPKDILWSDWGYTCAQAECEMSGTTDTMVIKMLRQSYETRKPVDFDDGWRTYCLEELTRRGWTMEQIYEAIHGS